MKLESVGFNVMAKSIAETNTIAFQAIVNNFENINSTSMRLVVNNIAKTWNDVEKISSPHISVGATPEIKYRPRIPFEQPPLGEAVSVKKKWVIGIMGYLIKKGLPDEFTVSLEIGVLPKITAAAKWIIQKT